MARQIDTTSEIEQLKQRLRNLEGTDANPSADHFEQKITELGDRLSDLTADHYSKMSDIQCDVQDLAAAQNKRAGKSRASDFACSDSLPFTLFDRIIPKTDDTPSPNPPRRTEGGWGANPTGSDPVADAAPCSKCGDMTRKRCDCELPLCGWCDEECPYRSCAKCRLSWCICGSEWGDRCVDGWGGGWGGPSPSKKRSTVDTPTPIVRSSSLLDPFDTKRNPVSAGSNGSIMERFLRPTRSPKASTIADSQDDGWGKKSKRTFSATKSQAAGWSMPAKRNVPDTKRQTGGWGGMSDYTSSSKKKLVPELTSRGSTAMTDREKDAMSDAWEYEMANALISSISIPNPSHNSNPAPAPTPSLSQAQADTCGISNSDDVMSSTVKAASPNPAVNGRNNSFGFPINNMPMSDLPMHQQVSVAGAGISLIMPSQVPQFGYPTPFAPSAMQHSNIMPAYNLPAGPVPVGYNAYTNGTSFGYIAPGSVTGLRANSPAHRVPFGSAVNESAIVGPRSGKGFGTAPSANGAHHASCFCVHCCRASKQNSG